MFTRIGKPAIERVMALRKDLANLTDLDWG